MIATSLSSHDRATEVAADDIDALAARVAFEMAEVLARPSVGARVQLARAFARAGAVDDAPRARRSRARRGPARAQLYELAAQLETRRGNAPRAALYAREAGELDPGGSGWRAMAVR